MSTIEPTLNGTSKLNWRCALLSVLPELLLTVCIVVCAFNAPEAVPELARALALVSERWAR